MKEIIIYTVHKAASMFLHKLSKEIAHEFDIQHYSINGEKYYEEIKQLSWKTFIEDNSRKGCYGPVRGGETKEVFPESLSDYSVILHLRDPRDVLTSLYFSQAYAHSRQKGKFNPSDEQREEWIEEGIDEYVTQQSVIFKARYEKLVSNLIGLPDSHFVRYEDMVLNYPQWLESFLAAFSHLSAPPKKILGINRPTKFSSIQRRLLKKFRNEFGAPRNGRYLST